MIWEPCPVCTPKLTSAQRKLIRWIAEGRIVRDEGRGGERSNVWVLGRGAHPRVRATGYRGLVEQGLADFNGDGELRLTAEGWMVRDAD
ncbi:hypothetical protein ACFOGJ_16010 [Marinibaculum pumilum]|uniref:Uncharacterized protein n=1 Tax=Marinibaculum pumilum TaxID=1766165 RepID=A0ABV7L2N6_9PROT